jgi:hypothetical protein
MGAPDEPSFQRRVLMDVLQLLESPGPPPVLEDFPEDEPESSDITVLACPVNFHRAAIEEGDTEPLRTEFLHEMKALRPWYNASLNIRHRTTVGVSNIDLDELGDFIYAFSRGEEPVNPRSDIPLAYTLKLAVEDLKSYYIEGITSQPGQAGASSKVLQDWFWDETAAGRVLMEIKKACEASDDKMMNMIGSRFIVPGDVARRQLK